MSEINETPRSEQQIVVCIANIKNWLKEGITRRIGDPGYNAELGSVQEKYGLNKAEVTALFQDLRLKGLKVCTPKPSRILIAEDMESEDLTTLEAAPDAVPSDEAVGSDSTTGATYRGSISEPTSDDDTELHGDSSGTMAPAHVSGSFPEAGNGAVGNNMGDSESVEF